MSERLPAATRTRRVRKVVGPGPRIDSTPPSHTAYLTTVHTVNPRKVAEQLRDAFPGQKVTESDTGFVMLSWSTAD